MNRNPSDPLHAAELTRERALRLLLVEDCAALRRTLARYLESLGAQVVPAGSLGEAREVLAEQPCDAAVLDVGLPDGDGLSLLALVAAPRCLVMSACPEASRYARLGVRHHLAKPFDLHELREWMDRIQGEPMGISRGTA
jgi:DNA-binding response OmpR family regulator